MKMKSQFSISLFRSFLITLLFGISLAAPSVTKALGVNPLIDVDLGAGTATSETGFAATGQSAGDFWNYYTRDDGHGGYLSLGGLSNLRYADGTSSGAGFTIVNGPGCYGNGAADPMYNGYLYPFDGGNIVLTLTNLAATSYDFYIYGHGNANNQNSGFQVSVDGQSYGIKTNLNGPGWSSSAVWQEGLQYVKFPAVPVGAGQTVVITVSPASSSYAILSGLQILQTAPAAPVAPTITSQPANATVTAGQNVLFSAGVSGSFPLSYQWFFNGNTVTGATNLTLTLNAVQATNAGSYYLTVTNSVGFATSSNALLTVNPVVYTPVAYNQTVSLIENTSVPLTLTGTISNNATLFYAVVTQPTNGTLTGIAPNLTYQPALNFSGADNFTFQASYGTQTSAVATVSLNVLAQNTGPLIDVDFGAGTNTAEVGFAATGNNTNDFWNYYSRDGASGQWKTFGCLSNLNYVDQSASGASLTISNAPGCWGNGSTDPMYNAYLYPFNGGNITVTVNNLATGSYSFYIYGHGNTDNQYSVCQLCVDGQTYGLKTNSAPTWTSPTWQEGAQYVKFPNVSISAGQVVSITVFPGPGGYAVLSGIQMAQAATITGLVAASQNGTPQSLLSFNLVSNSVPPPMLLSIPKPNSRGFTFAGVIGHDYRIEASASPVSTNWTPIAVITVDRSPFTFADPDQTPRSQRFYRVVVLR